MSRLLQKNPSEKKITFVQFFMVPNHENIRARRYKPEVKHFSKRFGLSQNLVYAIIKTESNFNPYAISSAPAYGLMQLVPSTGGRDAYYKVKGVDKIPSRQYLFNSRNNIELGTAYFNLVYYQYLKKIKNPVSREYCAIAAYNTGSGNVLKTFSKNRDEASRIINKMKPSAVYAKLKKHLNSHEARRYLVKVMEARRQFVNI
jgi:membrane-bound lytic murein transglycosylase C